MDYRSETDKRLHDIIMDALHFLEKPTASRVTFRDLVGELRDAKVMLDNKRFGCPAGKHAAVCRCIERRAA